MLLAEPDIDRRSEERRGEVVVIAIAQGRGGGETERGREHGDGGVNFDSVRVLLKGPLGTLWIAQKVVEWAGAQSAMATFRSETAGHLGGARIAAHGGLPGSEVFIIPVLSKASQNSLRQNISTELLPRASKNGQLVPCREPLAEKCG